VIESAEMSIPARLRGAWMDRSLDYDAVVDLDRETVRIAYDPLQPQVMELPVSSLDGAVFADDLLTLYFTTGKKVSLYGADALEGLRQRIEAAACAFPEQTLSLRNFGSERSAPGSDHDRWFEALLTARRVAEESHAVETQRRAFDAGRLGRHAQITREGWAAERFDAPADRRALEAELEEIAIPYGAALFRLEDAALALRQASDARQFAEWRIWQVSVRVVFRAADETWAAVVPVLADSRGAKGAFWRRLLRQPAVRGAS
jgi:hypothetical protein